MMWRIIANETRRHMISKRKMWMYKTTFIRIAVSAIFHPTYMRLNIKRRYWFDINTFCGKKNSVYVKSIPPFYVSVRIWLLIRVMAWHRTGEKLSESMAPSSTMWCFDGSQFMGRWELHRIPLYSHLELIYRESLSDYFYTLLFINIYIYMICFRN